MTANELVRNLDDVCSRFDSVATRFGLEKIKTIGDAYMAVCGLLERCANHAGQAAEMALAMMDEIASFNTTTGFALNIRVGLNSGPVVAGVIGKHKFSYDLWGETVTPPAGWNRRAIPAPSRWRRKRSGCCGIGTCSSRATGTPPEARAS
jgi:adenylate cyclase